MPMVPSPQFDLDEYGVDVGPYVDAFAAACDVRGAALDVPEGALFVSLGQIPIALFSRKPELLD